MKISIDCPYTTSNHEPQMVGWTERGTTLEQLQVGVWVPLHCDPERGGCDRECMAHVQLKGEKVQVRYYKLEEF